MKETEESKVWMPGVSPELYEKQSAELTKLKADVVKLRTALDVAEKEMSEEKQTWMCEIHSEKLADNIVKEQYARGRVNGVEVAEQILARALEETKP